MMKSRLLCGMAILVAGLALPVIGITNITPATPTFCADVAPILFKNCASCHRPGDIAPMSLLTYDAARPWARAIKLRTSNHEMPPWFVEKTVENPGQQSPGGAALPARQPCKYGHERELPGC